MSPANLMKLQHGVEARLRKMTKFWRVTPFWFRNTLITSASIIPSLNGNVGQLHNSLYQGSLDAYRGYGVHASLHLYLIQVPTRQDLAIKNLKLDDSSPARYDDRRMQSSPQVNDSSILKMLEHKVGWHE